MLARLNNRWFDSFVSTLRSLESLKPGGMFNSEPCSSIESEPEAGERSGTGVLRVLPI